MERERRERDVVQLLYAFVVWPDTASRGLTNQAIPS
jgi:hypothetical protein